MRAASPRTEEHRWIGLAGLALVALEILSFAIVFPGAPEAERSDATILDWYTASGNQVRLIASAVLASLGFAMLLVFLNGLRRTLEAAGARQLLVDLAFSAGLVLATLAFVSVAVGSSVVATFVYSDTFELDPDTARIVLMIGNVWTPAVAGIPGGLLVGAASLAARETGLFAPWLVWVGFAIAVLAFVPLFGVNAYLVLVWVLLVSVVVLRRR